MEQQGSEEEGVTGKRLTASPRSQRATQVEIRLDLELAGSPGEESAAERPLAEEGGHGGDDDSEGSEEDFAFAVADGSSFDGFGALTADEMFSNGLIRPQYPLFDRALVLDGGESSLRGRGGGNAGGASSGNKKKPAGRLPQRLREMMVEDRDPPTLAYSSESEELDGLPAGSYCVWGGPRSAPASPDLRRKSHSAGAGEGSKRWRLLDLVVGRSHSDGKEKLVFLQEGAGGAGQSKKKASAVPPEAEKKGKGKGRTTEMDMVTAHRLFYARGGAAAAAAAAGNRRRSFLPYRQDLIGLFHNVNGPSSFQPPF